MEPKPSTSQTVTCPLCAEEIQRDAVKCTHCGTLLLPRKDPLAIISFIFAFFPIFCFCIGIAPFVCAILSLFRIRNYRGILAGKKLAIAAIIIAVLMSISNALIIVGIIGSIKHEDRRRVRAPFQEETEMEIGNYWQEAERFRKQLAQIVNQTQTAYKAYKKNPSNPQKLFANIDKLNIRYNELKGNLPSTTEKEFEPANKKLEKMVQDVSKLLEQFDTKRLAKKAGTGMPNDNQIRASIESFNRNMQEFFQERDKAGK